MVNKYRAWRKDRKFKHKSDTALKIRIGKDEGLARTASIDAIDKGLIHLEKQEHESNEAFKSHVV